MEHIYKIKGSTMSYPTTTNFAKNIKLIPQYCNAIKKYVKLESKEREIYEITLVCTGSSGSIICGAIMNKLVKNKFFENINIYVLHIKKNREDSHNTSDNIYLFENLIVIDDFIQYGETINRCIKETHKRIDMIIVSGIVYKKYIKHEKTIKYIACRELL